MCRKNFKVDTVQKGQTAKSENKHPFVYKTLNTVEKTNVPTGKVTTLEDKKKRREEREKKYRDFRIKALQRRAARMKIPEEKVQELVEKLREQLDAPKQYTILCLFPTKTPTKKGEASVANLAKQAILNNKIDYKLLLDGYAYIVGDASVLAKIREIMPNGVTIHPYAKKMDAVLPAKDPPKKTKKPSSKADKKSAALNAKIRRKQHNKLAFKHRTEHKQAKMVTLAAKKSNVKTAA